MGNREARINFWLEQVKEAKQEGQDDYDAAQAAEKATRQKYGKVPEEGG